MVSSWRRLLCDIENGCVRLTLFKEKYDVFSTAEGITIVRLDSTAGSVSLTIPSGKVHEPCIDVEKDENWEEKIPKLLGTGKGTKENLDLILQEYHKALHATKESYFRSSWYDDADDSLKEVTNANGAILFERYFDNEKNEWIITPLHRLRGGRFGKVEKMPEKQFSLSLAKRSVKPDTTRSTTCNIHGDSHPLNAALLKMCGQNNTIEGCFFESLNNSIRTLKALPPMNNEKLSKVEIDKQFNTVIDWVVAVIPVANLLASALRCSYLMKFGIDTGTKKVRFPERGFNDQSSDSNDIPREEDRNAKLFLLALSVFASGTLFYPKIGSLDRWEFRKESKQEEMRFIHIQAERLVSLLVQRSHRIENLPITDKQLENASVSRALSYLKGERKLFKHQVEGLEWSLKMEKSEHRGGFIACDMGMGKTIQVLLLHLCYEPEHRGKTLVIVPPGLLRQPWYKEATDERYWGKRNKPFGIPLLFVRGAGKGKPFPTHEDVNRAQLVITSYNILSSHATLKQIPFRRVILDESTYIKTPTAQRSLAVRGIRSEFHWCLSGTPIENKKEDYLGQLLFLHIMPFYHQDWWYERFETDRHRMFYCTMFKRNFENIIDGSLVEHPPILVFMNESETKKYNDQKDLIIRSILGSNDISSQGHQIMKLLRLSRAEAKIQVLAEMCSLLVTPLRSFNDCFHWGYYYRKLLSTMLENIDKAKTAIGSGKLVPSRNSISHFTDSLKDLKEDKVKEMTDTEMFLEMFELQCSNTLKDFVYDWNYVLRPNDAEDLSDYSSDDKPLLLSEDVKSEETKSNVGDQAEVKLLKNRELFSNEKCVVFVQGADRAKKIGEELRTRSMLNVVVRASGSEKGADKIISQFQEDSSVNVLVLTYRGGAHGLNLQVARNIFLVDPDWNPAILMQAIARCYRIGQTHDVHVYNLLTANSIEDRVQQVIQRKIKVFRENISAVGEDITDWTEIHDILKSSIST